VGRDVPFWLTAVLLLWTNWRVGANWIIAISELSVPGKQAFYHHFLDKTYPHNVKLANFTSAPSPGFFISILLVALLIVVDTLLTVFYFLGSDVVSAIAKYLLLFVALFVLALNLDFSGLSQKIRTRAMGGETVDGGDAWRVYDSSFLLSPLPFFILAGLIWAYDEIGPIHAWIKMLGLL
jgi:hypothetical protein